MTNNTAKHIAPRLAATAFCLLPLTATAMFELGEAQERDEELWQHLSETRHEVRAGLGFLSEDSFMFGRFSGLTDDGPFLDLHIDLHERPAYDADAMRYWRLRGRNLGIDSRALRGEYGSQGSYSVFFDFRQMPHNEWGDVRTWHRGDGSSTLTLPATANPRDEDLLRVIDIGQERQRITIGGDYLLPDMMGGRWRVSGDVSREERDGTRVRGFGAFSAANPFLAPEMVDQRTDQYNARLEYLGDRLHASAAYHLSVFSQNDDSWMFIGNPHDDGDWGETDSGELASFGLEPANAFHQFSLAGAYNVAPGSRVSADLHIGRMLQDDDFVFALDDGTDSLDGEIETTAASLQGTHRFTPRMRLRASYRYDDRDNQTDVFEIDGRETRPLSFTRHHYAVEGDYRMGARSRLTAGVERDERERDFGYRRDTDENTVHAGFRTPLIEGMHAGVRVAVSQLDGSTYDSGEEQLPEGLRNYDVADRDRLQLRVFGTYTPPFLPTVSLSGRADYIEDDYSDSDYGRTDAEHLRASGEIAWVPAEDLTLHAFAASNMADFDLAGESAGGVPWTAEHEDRSYSAGGGAEWAFRPDQIDLGAEVVWVDTTGRVRPGNGDPAPYPTLESTLTRFSLYGDYHVDRDMTFQLRYVFERFDETDWALDAGVDGVEDLITLDREERDYTAHMVVGSVAYRW